MLGKNKWFQSSSFLLFEGTQHQVVLFSTGKLVELSGPLTVSTSILRTFFSFLFEFLLKIEK